MLTWARSRKGTKHVATLGCWWLSMLWCSDRMYHSILFRSFRVLCMATLNYPSAPSSDWQWRDSSPTHFLMPVRPFANPPPQSGCLKGWDSPWSDVSMRALIQVVVIWSVCCESIFDKALLNWERGCQQQGVYYIDKLFIVACNF